MAPDAGDGHLELFPRPSVAEAGARRGGAAPPLLERMRPRSLDEVVGQSHLVGPDGPLRALSRSGQLPSLILWGPPGSGKTTLARLLATGAGARLVALSAVTAGVREVRQVVAEARSGARRGERTVLFLDEIHRFNRAQQDALLPHVESGALTLVGATTENPSFEVNAPLLSRCRVYRLRRLEAGDLVALCRRALADRERGLGQLGLDADEALLRALAEAADGDARRALGLLEAMADLHRIRLPERRSLAPELLAEVAGSRVLLHDRDREEHHNLASAFIKSLRASDPDAALYYLARLLEAGDDPLFAARRMVIFASEDVGNADPAALPLALAACQAVERIGLPEGRIPLAQAATYLALAPRSKAAYRALGRAEEAVRRYGSQPVPLHLRNAPTGLMAREGHGAGYRDPHDETDAFVPDRNLPDAVPEEPWYQPVDRGAEAELARRLRRLRERRARMRPAPEGAAAQHRNESPEPAPAGSGGGPEDRRD